VTAVENRDVTAYARKLFHATGIAIVAIYWFTPVDRSIVA